MWVRSGEVTLPYRPLTMVVGTARREPRSKSVMPRSYQFSGPVQLWYIINNIQSWLGIYISAVELLERPDRVLVDFHRCTRQGSRYTNNIDVKSVVSTVSTQLNAPEPAWAYSRSERYVRRTGTQSGSRCRSWGRPRTCFQHQAWWVWKELSVLNRVWFISLTTACLL